jgi:macrolide transport system ATP-binding/permease protein
MHRDLIGAHSYELEILEFFGPVAVHAQFLTGPIAMNDVILDLSGIEKHYQNGDTVVRALDGVSLKIHSGEFVAIMGQSGSGKSTLMNIIGCLDRPTSGSYRVLGKEAANLSADELAALRRETFGFVFQRYNLLATATAGENVEIPSVYAGLPKQKRSQRANRLLQRLGMADRTDHRPAELSGGQQQRVAIARALVNDPPVILADEPTGALDSKSGDEVLVLLKELHAEGRTIILITHAETVAQHASRIVRIQDGQILEDSGVVRKETSSPVDTELNLKSAVTLAASMHEALVTAWRSLRVNIFRTVLTLLGIIIGVAAVVAMLAVGEGSRQKVLDRISSFGTNLMLIRPGAAGIRNTGDIVTLIPEDAAAIRALPNIETALPERSGRMTVRFGNRDYQTSVQGTGEDFPKARDWKVAEGQFFNADDMKQYAPVVVLGRTVAKTLFPDGGEVVGNYVLLKNVPFLVIGVMSEKGASPNGSDQDDVIFTPINTGLVRLFGKSYLSSITIKVADAGDIAATQERVENLLRERHRTEDFSVRNMASFLQAAMETQDTFTLLLGTVAAISLLVGGIGVMNIMLVSVVERTREIGIRMATGARMRDILLQFNIEAAVVCAAGGLLGILVGVAAGMILRYSGMSVIFSLTPAVLAFACASATGLIFGYLPARKAARLDPVVALASE